MKIVHPNNFCPCGSGMKYRSCCMPKLSGIEEEKLSIKYLSDLIKQEGILEEQLEFFTKEAELSKEEGLVHHICEIKKCFCRGIMDYKSLRTVLSINSPGTQMFDDPLFKKIVVEAGSQFIAQLSGLTEDEFVEIHDVLDGIVELQIAFPKECREQTPENL